MKDALKSQGNNNNNDNNKINNNSGTNNNKRKREICDAIAKTAKKKKQKASAWSFQNLLTVVCIVCDFNCISREVSSKATFPTVRDKPNRFIWENH